MARLGQRKKLQAAPEAEEALKAVCGKGFKEQVKKNDPAQKGKFGGLTRGSEANPQSQLQQNSVTAELC